MGQANKQIWVILFFGAAWGLLEATVGYGLHLLSALSPLPITGALLFPAGFYLLQRTFKETRNPAAVLYCGMIAATIKMFDLLLPVPSWDHVVHPAIAILLEAMAATVLLNAWNPRKFSHSIAAGVSVALGWRLAYVLALVILPLSQGLFAAGPAKLVTFLVAEPLVNGVLIGAILQLDRKDYSLSARFARPASSTALFALAALAQLGLTLAR